MIRLMAKSPTTRRLAAKTGILLGLLTLGAAPAQQEAQVYMRGGIFSPARDVNVEVYAPKGTVFTLRQVLNPEQLLMHSRNPSKPTIPANLATRAVKTLKAADGYQLNLGRLDSGVYLLGHGKMATVVMVTNLGLVVKQDSSVALAYTADLKTGKVRAANIWTTGGQQQTSRGGLAPFKITNADKDFFVLARSGKDWAISESGWNTWAGSSKVRGYVYTDRPVYRPGQHVDFKGVLRDRDTLKALAGRSFTVTVFSPDNEQVFRQTLKANEFGSLAAGFDLPEASRVGAYRFRVTSAENSTDNEDTDVSSTFVVEAYQKPEYSVNISASQPKLVQGEKTHVKVSAQYLFGGAVSGARVKYRVVQQPTYSGDWWDEDREYQGDKLIVQEDTRLDANGQLDILLPLEKNKSGQPVNYRVEAEVEDEARRPFSAQTSFTAYPASVTVEAHASGFVFDAGKNIPVTVNTRNLKDQGQPATVLLELVRQDWTYTRGNENLKETVVASKTVKTDAKGQLETTLNAAKGGGYLLRATVKDAQSRRSRSEDFVWVFKAGESWNWYSHELSIQFDKEKYISGDTATVLVINPNPGADVLLTVEGEKLRNKAVLRGGANGSAVLRYSFKVTDDMAPNIYVGATSMQSNQIYTGEQSVGVSRRGAKLSVRVQPTKAKYAPGDKGTFTVSVKDASGKGVRSELAFSVVDQAIYLIRPDSASAMLDVFEAPRQNVVGTNRSDDFSFEAVGTRSAANGKMAVPSMAAPTSAADASVAAKAGEAGASESAVTPRVDFRDTLLWIPRLVTDAQGRATVEVTFPDNLTTWVGTARAHTVEPRFGESTAKIMTTKDVVARLSLPPFLVRGDQVTLSGIVNNTLGKPVTGKASMDLNGLSGLGGNVLQGTPLNIPALGRQRFDAQATAKALGQAQVTFTARSSLGNDALRLPVPVKARGYDMSVTSVSGGGTTMNLPLPADTAPESVRLRLDLTPSLLSAVAPALEYLIGYPYGCTEQTMSRFLPALLARQTLGENGLPASVRRNLNRYADVGLARLQDFQHEDGGWNFWENDTSTVEMTAYVVDGLMRARSTGTRVSNRMVDRGLNYLAQHVTDKGISQGERARAYRVLANAGRARVADLLAFSGQKLKPYALAQISLALNTAGQKQAAQSALTRLKAARSSTQGDSLVYWQGKAEDGWNWYWEDNNNQVTAAALEALATLEPGSPLIPRVSQWLLMQRRGPQWLSTQDTASVIMAALKLPRVKAQNAGIQVLLDSKTVGKVTVKGNAAATFNLAPKLPAGKHTLTLKGAPSSLIAAAKLSFSREPAALNGINTGGLTLTRRYERLIPTWNVAQKRYIYTKTPVLNGKDYAPVQVGDLLLVTLTVDSKRQARYLLVSDPIPAGFKALDDRSLAFAGEIPRNNWWEWSYWYSGRDLLDDRVDLYAAWLDTGPQKMTYILRAQTPGKYTALPTHAFLMYDPDVEGYGPAANFSVVERKD